VFYSGTGPNLKEPVLEPEPLKILRTGTCKPINRKCYFIFGEPVSEFGTDTDKRQKITDRKPL